MHEEVDHVTMTDREKYLFDLHGFLVVKGFLSREEVKSLNDALDANEDRRGEFGPPHQTADGLKGKWDIFRLYSGLLTWPKPWCQPFRDLLAHSKLIPYCNTIFGRGWRLDHGVDAASALIGCSGLHLHGYGNAELDGTRYHRYQNGRIRCALTVFQYQLADVNPGDGGLVVIPGSHKANFPLPKHIRYYEYDREVVYNPPAKAGDLNNFQRGDNPWYHPVEGTWRETSVILPLCPKIL